MKKGLRFLLIVLGVLIGIIGLDTLQAKVFDNRPLIKITENYGDGNILKRDKGILVYTYVLENGERKTVYRWSKYSPLVDDLLDLPSDDNKNEESDKMDSVENINVIINSQTYSATIEDNETARAFINLLPQEFDMEELNSNEKYVYMDHSLPTNSMNPRHIVAGDIMLYGRDCLVIFYKSFETNYSYTKIGHIDNLPDLGIDDVTVKFQK